MSNIGLTEWECREIAEERLMEEKFGNLTCAQRERLEMLAEEASEVAKACMKILRHGYMSHNPYDPKKMPNRLLLQNELEELWCIYERMADYNDLGRINFYNSVQVWQSKLQYTHHQPPFSHPTLPRERPADGTAADQPHEHSRGHRGNY